MDTSFVRDVFVGFSGLYAGWLHVCVPIRVPMIHAASAVIRLSPETSRFNFSRVLKEITMKQTMFSLVIFAAMLVGATPSAQAGCTNATLNGGYGLFASVTLLPAGTPRSILG